MIYRISIPALLFLSVRADSQDEARRTASAIAAELVDRDFYIAEGKTLLERIMGALHHAGWEAARNAGHDPHSDLGRQAMAPMQELRVALDSAMQDPAGFTPMASIAHNNGNGGVVIEDEAHETVLTGEDLWWRNLADWIDEDWIDEDDESITLSGGSDVFTKAGIGRYAIIEESGDDIWLYSYATAVELVKALEEEPEDGWHRVHVLDLQTNREIEYEVETHVRLRVDE